MKHFDIWQWTEFVRGQSGGAARSAMERHLSSGCPTCRQTVNLLHDVAVTALGDINNEPPENAVRCAEALFSLHRPDRTSFPRLVARLIYDSIREPLAVGLRGQDRTARRALYAGEGYSLDLQLEHQPASGFVTLVGQLADPEGPDASAAEIPVWLMERKTLVASTLCNQFGEFQLEYDANRHLRLCIPLRAVAKRLEIPLDRIAPGRPSQRQVKNARPAAQP